MTGTVNEFGLGDPNEPGRYVAHDDTVEPGTEYGLGAANTQEQDLDRDDYADDVEVEGADLDDDVDVDVDVDPTLADPLGDQPMVNPTLDNPPRRNLGL